MFRLKAKNRLNKLSRFFFTAFFMKKHESAAALRRERNVGLPGRLTKDAGTHLASWLQLVSNVSEEDATTWVESPRHERTAGALKKIQELHGKKAGHSSRVIDAAFSGQLLATKDKSSMRLWRARDGNLLRVIGACNGKSVAFSPSGQNIVTGTVGSKLKIWGPAGGSAVGCGKTKITAGKA